MRHKSNIQSSGGWRQPPLFLPHRHSLWFVHILRGWRIFLRISSVCFFFLLSFFNSFFFLLVFILSLLFLSLSLSLLPFFFSFAFPPPSFRSFIFCRSLDVPPYNRYVITRDPSISWSKTRHAAWNDKDIPHVHYPCARRIRKTSSSPLAVYIVSRRNIQTFADIFLELRVL